MERSDIHRKVLFEGTATLGDRLDGLDPGRLRWLLSDLFDRAALAVHRAGYDLDDVVVENVLVCCVGEAVVEVPIGGVSDRAALVQTLRAAMSGQADSFSSGSPMTISGLRCRATLEQWVEFGTGGGAV